MDTNIKQLPKSSLSFSLMLHTIWILYLIISGIFFNFEGNLNDAFISNLVIKAIMSNLYIVVLPVLLKIFCLSSLDIIKEEGFLLKVFIKSLRFNFRKEKDVFLFFGKLTIVGLLLGSILIAAISN